MANDTYRIDLLASGGSFITVNDDGSGIDWLELRGSYAFQTSISLNYSNNFPATNASGIYYLPGGITNTLVVNGAIENVRGCDSSDYVAGNELANLIFGDQARTGIGAGDNLNGVLGNDTIYGGAGDDTIGGGGDNDSLFGDAGNDSINGDGGSDTVEGGTGADTLSGGATPGDTVAYTASGAGVRIDITHGSTTTGFGGHAAGDQISSFLNVIGSSHNDVITDTFATTIAFGYNDNTFDGGLGDDRLIMGGGNDVANGGDGRDTISGGIGADVLRGDAGADHINGGNGGDTLNGGTGNDTLIGGDTANDGRDVLNGGDGDDLINGAVGNDTVYAGLGNDVVLGGGGNDELLGQDGNDDLRGGAGLDRLTGGIGADRFIFAAASESGVIHAARDVIVDFRRVQGDRIHLAGIDADDSQINDQAFTYIGTAAFDGRHGLLRIQADGTSLIVSGDINGDQTADFAITLLLTAGLNAGDFVL